MEEDAVMVGEKNSPAFFPHFSRRISNRMPEKTERY